MNTIRKALLLCPISSMASITMSAQYMVSNKYDVWLEDTGEELYTRKNVDCTGNVRNFGTVDGWESVTDVYILRTD